MLSIENRGMLKATGWTRLTDSLPDKRASDGENAVITKNINFIINNAEYDNTQVYNGLLFVSWDGEYTLMGSEWGGQDVNLDLAGTELIDDIYYKDINVAKLHVLERERD